MLLFFGLGTPSDEFIYLSGIAGILGFFLGLVTVPQVLLGKPRLRVWPTTADKWLVFHVKNGPEGRWLLRNLVHRDAAHDTFAVFDVVDDGTGEIKANQVAATWRVAGAAAGEEVQRLTIPASEIPVILFVLGPSMSSQTVWGVRDGKKSIQIGEGRYRFEMTLMSGAIKRRYKYRFSLRAGQDAQWLERIK